MISWCSTTWKKHKRGAVLHKKIQRLFSKEVRTDAEGAQITGVHCRGVAAAQLCRGGLGVKDKWLSEVREHCLQWSSSSLFLSLLCQSLGTVLLDDVNALSQVLKDLTSLSSFSACSRATQISNHALPSPISGPLLVPFPFPWMSSWPSPQVATLLVCTGDHTALELAAVSLSPPLALSSERAGEHVAFLHPRHLARAGNIGLIIKDGWINYN